MHLKTRNIFLVVGLLLICITITFVATSISRDDAVFAPSTYGLPDEIAGYRLLAVKTSQNTLCYGTDLSMLILQAPYTDMATLFSSASNLKQVRMELQKLDPDPDWQLNIVSPGITARDVIRNIKNSNRAFRHGCVQLGGGPHPTSTALP